MTTWKMHHLLKVSHRLIKPISEISAYSYSGQEVKLSVLPTWFTSWPLWLLSTIQSQISLAWHQGHQHELIPPWKLHKKICPSTVVLIPRSIKSTDTACIGRVHRSCQNPAHSHLACNPRHCHIALKPKFPCEIDSSLHLVSVPFQEMQNGHVKK